MCTYLIFQLPIAYKETNPGELPVGPAVKTPHFQCRGRGFNPWSGNLRSHMPHSAAKINFFLVFQKLKEDLGLISPQLDNEDVPWLRPKRAGVLSEKRGDFWGHAEEHQHLKHSQKKK